jgi:DNA-binding CsgD family transcriptional regulator
VVTELSPAAQAAFAALAAVPARPVKALIAGGVGTGKSTTLTALRDKLRGAGIAVSTRPPEPGETPSAVIVDDVHLLSDVQLRTLTELAADPATTVVVAAEPREHDPDLRALTVALEREHPRIALGPWSRAEVSRRLAIGDPGTLEAVMATTAGVPSLVEAASTAGWSADAIAHAVEVALTERLRRLDEPMLSTLLVMSLSPGLGPADVAATLGISAEAARTLVDRSYATGLLDPSHGARFVASLHRAVAALTGAVSHHAVESALLRSQDELSTLSTDLALTLAEHGLRDPLLGAVLKERAVRANLLSHQKARLLRAALSAGAAGADVEIRLADALALGGDCSSATARVDSLLNTRDPVQRAAAVRVGASVAAHDGNTAQAADLFGWLASSAESRAETTVGAAGAIVFVAAGQPGAASAMAASQIGPPTSSARTNRSLAEGLLLTLDQPYAVAAARLGQALGAEVRTPEAMPESAPALVTLAALHAGDAVRARNVITRAVADDSADEMFSHRHRLLRAWTRMLDGQLQAAASDVVVVTSAADLHRRDALWAAALQTAVARRAGDTGALQKHWSAAMDVLAEFSIDLFCMLPLGELWVAATRLRQAGRLSYPLDQAFGLLTALGDPPAWSLPLHWAGVHAAILANSPESMAPHGQALTAAAETSPFAAALARAGRTWLRVLARRVDVDEVASAARGLAQFGLTWDGTRLAGHAALQAADPRVSGAMLQVARDLKVTTDSPDLPAGPADSEPRATKLTPPARSPLSDREREVAELLLLGMPYRDIGAQLFISAKTVEHHVARIRRRLGAESRSDMLSMLRTILAPHA